MSAALRTFGTAFIARPSVASDSKWAWYGLPSFVGSRSSLIKHSVSVSCVRITALIAALLRDSTEMQLPGLRGLSLWCVLMQSLSKFFADDMPTYGAALALRALLALFPFLIFLLAMLAFLGAPGLFDWMREQASYLVPARGMEVVDNVLSDLKTPRGGLLSLGIVLAIYSASIAVAATMNALNVAYNVTERRPVWKRYLVSILYTAALTALLIAAALLMAVGPDQLRWLAGYVGLGELVISVWALLRWPVAVVLLMLTLALVYWAAPNVKLPFRLISPGAVLAVVVWIGASLLFAFYVRNFASYDATYGSIGAVVILLFYFYLSAAIMLFGAEFNAIIERESAQVTERESLSSRAAHPSAPVR